MRRFMKRPTNEQGCAKVAEREEVTYAFVSKSRSSRCEGVVVVHAGGVCVVAGDDRQPRSRCLLAK